MKVSIISVVSSLAAVASARLGRPVPPKLEMSAAETALATNGKGVFQQLLNHSNPAQGTFSQSYWWSSQFWNGPGSPVSLPR